MSREYACPFIASENQTHAFSNTGERFRSNHDVVLAPNGIVDSAGGGKGIDSDEPDP